MKRRVGWTDEPPDFETPEESASITLRFIANDPPYTVGQVVTLGRHEALKLIRHGVAVDDRG